MRWARALFLQGFGSADASPEASGARGGHLPFVQGAHSTVRNQAAWH
ncbi:hypothetical protein [Rubricoccus marinus]|nr:hypothetical protein [Rubricoccus marinus]